MFKERCRPKYSDEELAELYKEPWKMESDWLDHEHRQRGTLEVVDRLVYGIWGDMLGKKIRGADLSCGDGYLASQLPYVNWKLGDFAPGYEFQGPIEKTIDEIDRVDLFICTETLEHLDEPELVLQKLRKKTRALVVSTPNMYCWDENPQHYWAWDRHAIRYMLQDAGFLNLDCQISPRGVRNGHEFGYEFQIWGCS